MIGVCNDIYLFKFPLSSCVYVYLLYLSISLSICLPIRWPFDLPACLPLFSATYAVSYVCRASMFYKEQTGEVV